MHTANILTCNESLGQEISAFIAKNFKLQVRTKKDAKTILPTLIKNLQSDNNKRLLQIILQNI